MDTCYQSNYIEIYRNLPTTRLTILLMVPNSYLISKNKIITGIVLHDKNFRIYRRHSKINNAIRDITSLNEIDL